MNHRDGFRTYLARERGRSPKTITAYLGDLDRFERWLVTDLVTDMHMPILWHEVQTKHIRAYLTELDASPSYFHRVHSSLNMWFTYLVDVAEDLDHNPCKRIQKPRKSQRHPGALTMSEVEQLVRAALSHSRPSDRVRNWTMLAFLTGTGLRVSEFTNMDMSDIKHKEGYPHSITVIGKGNKQRKVILTESAKTALYQWLRARKRLAYDLPPDADRDAVWLNTAGRYKGTRLGTAAVRKLTKKFARLANIHKDVHPHLLRHTLATELVRNNASLHAIRDTLGHSNIATTSVYLHADEEELTAMAASLPDFLGGRPA